MAGLYDKVFVLGTAGIGGATNKFYFLARKGFYTGEIATATGVTVCSAAADKAAPVTAVKELLHSGVLKTVDVIATGTDGTKFKSKIHYAVAEDGTVEAALLATTLPTITGAKSSGAAITAISVPLRVTGRS
ncbi:MAG: hypothetical protein V7L23_18705 [Nostoc sp.]|uniref:hypothetical protein n=1 Tax=Nostoc sp. TaxID=1180 RepID=UPI002FF33E92